MWAESRNEEEFDLAGRLGRPLTPSTSSPATTVARIMDKTREAANAEGLGRP
jgi:hypothetical protein